MNTVRKLVAAMAMGATLVSAASVGAAEKGFVGIAMPTKSSARWIDDGNNMVKQLEKAGYKADLQYAEDDIPTQVSQIENMMVKGVNVLVIAAIDGTTLTNALENAHAADIKVIAYDRLIRDSDYVDYYATFDNTKVGVLQAESLVKGMQARGKGPYNVEALRWLAGRQQRLLLLQRRHVGAAAADRQGRDQDPLRADRYGQGRHPALGRRHRPGAHG
ncbi:substrate-binding domain-containing protein [Pseudomonas sp. OHS18]|uniref:substrate-binding domain-containing protein n=1 Tax=Pseudomonas sp. OHS18 TaxID=3399679 RepID=UPI003A8B0785